MRIAVDEVRESADPLPAESVLQELGACDLVVLVWSRGASRDRHVREQCEYAASFGKACVVRPLDVTAPPGGGDVERLPLGCGVREVAASVRRRLGARAGDGFGYGGVVGPGSWTIESDARYGESLTVELGPLVDGSAGPGSLTGTHRRAGLEGRVVGCWRFGAAASRLDPEPESAFGLRPVREVRRLQLLGGGDRFLAAEDLHGIADPRRYRLTRERRG
ncbi:hypothetical protein EHYA_10157 [Embleya hyalina]|uniref:TIR domain-containing protein n=1 Tax=Embleya hyalina TaxID=516124 RepID=A0A401Z689_9ACTN|nr:hypothetical protein EHYA_10157 [Embleya hyalina]